MNSKPIKRPSRIGAVWLTYRTRWALALGTLAALIVTSPAIYGLWKGIDYVTTAFPALPRPLPHASVVLGDDGEVKHGKTPEWSTLKSLWLVNGLASCVDLWTPGAMPKLESLTVFASIRDHQLIKLCDLYDLKALSLYQCQELTAAGMARLAEEPNLEHLHVANVYMTDQRSIPGELPAVVGMREKNRGNLLHFASEVKWSPSLKILYYDDTMGAPDIRLQEFQKLPKLHTLVTRLYPRSQSLQLTDETYQLVNSIPALRRLYLAAAGPHSPRHVEIQQAALPRLTVRPSHFNRTLGQRAGAVVMLGLGIVLILANQMSTQFLSPTSQLTPGYSRPHLLFVAVIAMFAVIGSFAILYSVGSSPLQATSLSVLPFLVIALATRLLRSCMKTPLPGFTNFGVIMPLLVFPVVAVQLTVGVGGSELNWFLNGQFPNLAVTLIAAAIWGMYDLAKWHVGIVRELEEGGVANAPLGMFDFKGWTEWGTQLQSLRHSEGKRDPIAIRGRDKDTERLIDAIQRGKPITSHQLWQLGQPQTAFKFSLIMAIALSLGASAVFLAREHILPHDVSLKVLTPAVMQVLMMGLILTPMSAWQRRPMFSSELLRPISRRDWKAMWFLGIASELASVLMIGFVMAGLLGMFGVFFEGWSVVQLVIASIVTISVTALIGSVSLWVLANESPWKSLIGVIFLTGVLTGIMLFAAMKYDVSVFSDVKDVNPYLMSLLILLPGIASAVFLVLAHRRWDRLEVGRLG